MGLAGRLPPADRPQLALKSDTWISPIADRLAIAQQAIQEEPHGSAWLLFHLRDLAESLIRAVALAQLAAYLEADGPDRTWASEMLLPGLVRPTTGVWVQLVNELQRRPKVEGAAEHLWSAARAAVSHAGHRPQLYRGERFVSERNRSIGHGAGLTRSRAEELARSWIELIGDALVGAEPLLTLPLLSEGQHGLHRHRGSGAAELLDAAPKPHAITRWGGVMVSPFLSCGDTPQAGPWFYDRIRRIRPPRREALLLDWATGRHKVDARPIDRLLTVFGEVALNAAVKARNGRAVDSGGALAAVDLDPPALVGRDWLFDRIERQLAANDGGGIVVTGGPGSGKSAVLLSLWHRRRRQDPAWFFRRAAGRVLPGAMLRHLIASLSPAPMQPTATLDGLADQLNQRLATHPGKQRVLIVDGLDEAVPADDGREPFELLPTKLPPGTLLVLAGRPTPHLRRWAAAAGWTWIDLSDPKLPVDADADALVEERLPTSLEGGSRRVAAQAVRAAGGHNALMLITLCEALDSVLADMPQAVASECLSAALTRMREVAAQGDDALFDAWWERRLGLTPTPLMRRAVRDVADLLCVSEGPIHVDLLEESVRALGRDEAPALDRLLVVLAPFLQDATRPGRRAERQLRWFHERFAAWVHSRMSHRRRLRAHGAIADGFAALGTELSQELAEYRLANLAGHLRLGGRQDAALETVIGPNGVSRTVRAMGLERTLRSLRAFEEAPSPAATLIAALRADAAALTLAPQMIDARLDRARIRGALPVSVAAPQTGVRVSWLRIESADPALVAVQGGHVGFVAVLAQHNDPRLFYSAGTDGVLATRRWSDGTIDGRLQLPEPVTCVTGSPDGGAAGTADGGLIAWGLDSEMRWRVALGAGRVLAVSIREGIVQAATTSGGIFQVDGTGSIEHLADVGPCALAQWMDGGKLVTVDPTGLVQWWASLKLVGACRLEHPPTAVAARADANEVGITTRALGLVVVSASGERRVCESPESNVEALSYLAATDEWLAVTSAKSVVRWDARTGGIRARHRGHGRGIGAVLAHPSMPRFATGCRDRLTRLFDATASQKRDQVAAPHKGRVAGLVQSQSCLFTASVGGQVRRWSHVDGVDRGVVLERDARVKCLGASGDSIVSADGRGVVQVWRAAAEGDVAIEGTWRVGGAAVAVAIHPDYVWVATRSRWLVRIDRQSSEVTRWKLDSPLAALVMAPDAWPGEVYAGNKQGIVSAFPHGPAWQAHGAKVTALTFAGDKLITGSRDRSVAAWRRPEVLSWRSATTAPVAAVHPDPRAGGRALVIGWYGRMCALDVDTGELSEPLAWPEAAWSASAVDWEGDRLFLGERQGGLVCLDGVLAALGLAAAY